MLERAGPGAEGQGSITGLFTVLVEGDDHNEPVFDAVRGILDGHMVLDRAIAERGRYPAVNVLRSVSRTMPDCNTPEQNALVDRARQLLAVYKDMAELIRLGAYRHGSDPQVDEAIHYYQSLENFLRQTKAERNDLDTCYRTLAEILDMQQTMVQAVPGIPQPGAVPQLEAAPPQMEPQILPQEPPPRGLSLCRPWPRPRPTCRWPPSR
jgi:flagellum-specific ATP synthase